MSGVVCLSGRLLDLTRNNLAITRNNVSLVTFMVMEWCVSVIKKDYKKINYLGSLMVMVI